MKSSFTMRTFYIILILPLILVKISMGNNHHWNYDDPHSWGGTCATEGRQHRQSPINIESIVPFDTTPFVFKNYGLINTTLINNGHSLKVNLQDIEWPMLDEQGGLGDCSSILQEDPRPQVSGGGLPGTYVLDSFHFHWGSESRNGSEHLLRGCAFPAEMHLVHYKKTYGSVYDALKYPDGLAVLGIWLTPAHAKSHHSRQDVLVTASKADYYYTLGTLPLKDTCSYTKEEHERASHHWFDMTTPHDNAESEGLKRPVHLRQMMPFDTSRFYRYEGSLTTPPCTENVLWTIFEDTVSVPEEFLEGLRLLASLERPTHRLSNNFRPPQSVSDRSVFYSGSAGELPTTCKNSHGLHAMCTDFPEVHIEFNNNVGEEETMLEHDELTKLEYEGTCPGDRLPSPINLHLGQAQPLYSLGLNWQHVGKCKGIKVLNDGKVLKVLYPIDSPEWLLTGGNLTSSYYLAAMNLRWGSEHHLGGLGFPLEVQLIHYNSKYKNFEEAMVMEDGVVVVSKFFQDPVAVDLTVDSLAGEPVGHNHQLAGIIYAVRRNAQNYLGDERMRSPNIRHLVGDTSTYYEYQGSLGRLTANSPCPSVTATWMVIRKVGHISNKQLESLRQMRSPEGYPITSNNRPLAPTGAHEVVLRVDNKELVHEFQAMLQMVKTKRNVNPLEQEVQRDSSHPLPEAMLSSVKDVSVSSSPAVPNVSTSAFLFVVILAILQCA